MKINEVAKTTGLTRKAIHFYIEGELLQPETSANNNYYEFNAQDIQTLQNIALPRQLDMPVTEIRDILDNPQIGCYSLHNLLENLRPELHDLMQKVQKLIYLLGTLPPKTDVDSLRTNSLSRQLNFEGRIEWIYDLYFHNENAVMLSILIWGSPLDVSITEHRSYLWKRLVDMARNEIGGPLRQTHCYLMALGWEVINEESIRRYFITIKTAKLAPASMEAYHQKCLESLRTSSRSQELMVHWKQVYHSILLPLVKFYENTSGFISEYNPNYAPYVQNNRRCYHLLMQDFKKTEIRLLRDLKDELDGMFDSSENDGCTLTTMYTYAQGAFSILPQARMRKLLEET